MAMIENIQSTESAKQQIDEARPLTRAEFCKLERMSLSTYHKIRRSGHGPDEMKFPQMAFVRITPEARREWHQSIEEYRKSKAAELEASRRSALAQAAGRKAAKSPRHVSKRAAKV
jgi:hypothetical protein